MSRASYDRLMQEIFPSIPWDEPLPATVAGKTWLCCRLCMAYQGLKAVDIEKDGFQNEKDFRQHYQKTHVQGSTLE